MCARIDGFPRHLGIHVGRHAHHPGALVQAPRRSSEPASRGASSSTTSVTSRRWLIRLDLLGLRMLSAIDDALRDIQADCGVCRPRPPARTSQVFAMIQAADTVGVFRSSRGRRCRRCRRAARDFDDLVVGSPSSAWPHQGQRRHLPATAPGPSRWLPPSSLEPVLAETLGVILYQGRSCVSPSRWRASARPIGRFPARHGRGAPSAGENHRGFVEVHGYQRPAGGGCRGEPCQVAGFASAGFNKSRGGVTHGYESAFRGSPTRPSSRSG